MKTCPSCKIIQPDSVATCECGMLFTGGLSTEDQRRISAEERLRFEVRKQLEHEAKQSSRAGRAFGWMAVTVLSGVLALIILGVYSESSKNPEEAARERARVCMEAEQYKLVKRGYSYNDGKLAAVLRCSDELDALKAYERPYDPKSSAKTRSNR